MERTLYEILGVTPSAALGEIQKRFHELARRHHPDVSPEGAAGHAFFAQVTEAYHVLKDPERRAQYDRERATKLLERWSRIVVPGARVEADFGDEVLVCRLHALSDGGPAGVGWRGAQGAYPPSSWGRMLHLAAPHGPPPCRERLEGVEGARIRLALFRDGHCLETETAARGWLWKAQGTADRRRSPEERIHRSTGRPRIERPQAPRLLVVGPVEAWEERQRRGARRASRRLAVRLILSGGTFVGTTLDVSATGLSIVISGVTGIQKDQDGRMAVQVDHDLWCDDLPLRVARVRQWLSSRGPSTEVGVQLHDPSAELLSRWRACLDRLDMQE